VSLAAGLMKTIAYFRNHRSVRVQREQRFMAAK